MEVMKNTSKKMFLIFDSEQFPLTEHKYSHECDFSVCLTLLNDNDNYLAVNRFLVNAKLFI